MGTQFLRGNVNHAAALNINILKMSRVENHARKRVSVTSLAKKRLAGIVDVSLAKYSANVHFGVDDGEVPRFM